VERIHLKQTLDSQRTMGMRQRFFGVGLCCRGICAWWRLWLVFPDELDDGLIEMH
jgi:hypothetical protein